MNNYKEYFYLQMKNDHLYKFLFSIFQEIKDGDYYAQLLENHLKKFMMCKENVAEIQDLNISYKRLKKHYDAMNSLLSPPNKLIV